MLFWACRLIFGSIIFIIFFFLIRKSKSIYKRRWYLISFAIAIILTTVSALIPVENAFITFSSPESSFGYVNSSNVKLVVNGDKTDFIVAQKDDTDVYLIIPKSDKGWKLGMGFDTKRVIQKISDEITVYVYQYQNSDNYYITVLNTDGEPIEITDNHESQFYSLDNSNNSLGKTFYTYYAYIQNFDDQYILTVNGTKIQVSNDVY